MRADDRQLRELGGDVIEVDRPSVIKFDSHPARHSCSERVCSGVKEGRDAELGDFFVQRKEARVIWIKSLDARMKLRALHPELGDCAFHFINREPSLPGVDGGEAHELVRVLFDYV